MISSIIGCIYSHLGDRMTGMFIKLSPSYWGCVVKFPEILSTPRVSGWWLTYPSEKYESQLGWWFPIYGKCSKPPTRYIHTCTYNRVLGIPVCHKGFLWKKIVQVRFSRGFATAKDPPSARSFGGRLLVLTHARCGYADACFQQSPLGVF